MAVSFLKQNLSTEEFTQLLSGATDVILVGGAAVAWWAARFEKLPDSGLDAGFTSDVDLLASRTEVALHSASLQSDTRLLVRGSVAPPDQQPPSTGRMLVAWRDEPDKQIYIDYISALMGFRESDIDRLKNRAVEYKLGSARFRVAHPFDCLKNKLLNVALLSSKCDRLAIKQLQLAADIFESSFRMTWADGSIGRREKFKLLDEFTDLAVSNHNIEVLSKHGVDITKSIDPDMVGGKFAEIQWPRITGEVRRKLEVFMRRASPLL